LLDAGEQDFCIRTAAERVSERLQLGPQFEEVVDLSIEDRNVPTRVRLHRLMTGSREVEDGETPKTEHDTPRGIEPHTFVIRAAVLQTAYLSRDAALQLRRRGSCERHGSCDTTHQRSSFTR